MSRDNRVTHVARHHTTEGAGGVTHAKFKRGMQPNRVANVSVGMMGAKEGVRVAGVGPSGTDHALAAVYRSHYGALVGTARLLLDDRESAEEVVQEAFRAPGPRSTVCVIRAIRCRTCGAPW